MTFELPLNRNPLARAEVGPETLQALKFIDNEAFWFLVPLRSLRPLHRLDSHPAILGPSFCHRAPRRLCPDLSTHLPVCDFCSRWFESVLFMFARFLYSLSPPPPTAALNLSLKEITGLERWLSGRWEHLLKTRVQFPAPTPGSAQPPVTLKLSQDLMSSADTALAGTCRRPLSLRA